SYMIDQHIDGWLLYDFRGNNPVLAQLLPGKRWTTRRALLFIPARGEPMVLAHAIDRSQFSTTPARCQAYLSWQELHNALSALIARGSRIAMEYSPGGALPAAAVADAGTIELIRALGAE